MSTTDLRHTIDCPNQRTFVTEDLVSPLVTFTIRSTMPCDDDHDSHLSYEDQDEVIHRNVDLIEFDVPGNEVTLVFKWRGSAVEDITLDSINGVTIQEDSVNLETRFIFQVPNTGESKWALDGGAPGFHLAVKVRSKS